MDEAKISVSLLSVKENLWKNQWDPHDGDIDQSKIILQISSSTNLNLKEDKVMIVAMVKYVYDEKDCFILESEFVFSVPELNKNITVLKSENKINFSVDIIPLLLQTAFGTMRGMLFEKLKDSAFQKYPLPLIDIKFIVSRNSLAIVE